MRGKYIKRHWGNDDPDSDLAFINPDEVPEAPEGMGAEEFAGGFEEGEGFGAAQDEDTGKAVSVLERLKKFFKPGVANG